VLARFEKMGDLFEPVQILKQKLPQLEGLVAGPVKEEDKGGKGISVATQPEAPPRSRKKTKKTKSTSKPATKAKSIAAKRHKV
jgi:hypothetical protein